MRRFMLILVMMGLVSLQANAQSFTVDDLLALSSVSPSHATHFMNKKNFSPVNKSDASLKVTSYFEQAKGKKKDTLNSRSIDIYKKDNNWYFIFHTTSKNEFAAGKEKLIKSGFMYDAKKDINAATSMLFQKRNLVVKTMIEIIDDEPVYTFLLEKKEIPTPANIRFAEDLLCFNSHEYLVSFFGTANVKKDLYYFTEKELKKCSVLFPNTSRQALFVWDDEENLCDLSYILVGDMMPTVSAEKFEGTIVNNKWELESGIRSGMTIRELLMLNEKDFEIYGKQSELAFFIKPESSGKINFKKTNVVLSCSNCNYNMLFNQKTIKAMDVVDENLPVYVHNIIITPELHK